MTDEEFVAAMEELFRSAGWKLLIATLEDGVAVSRDIANSNTVEQLNYNKGFIAAAEQVITFPRAVEEMSERLQQFGPAVEAEDGDELVESY